MLSFGLPIRYSYFTHSPMNVDTQTFHCHMLSNNKKSLNTMLSLIISTAISRDRVNKGGVGSSMSNINETTNGFLYRQFLDFIHVFRIFVSEL